KGAVIDDLRAGMAFAELLARHVDGEQVAVPVTGSDRLSELVAAHGMKVLPTKVSNAVLMEAATEPGVGFALNNAGGYILPGFLPAFDAAAALVKLLEVLAL